MATEDYYKTDWIIQINTNVNVANSRKWFSTFTAFDLHLGEGSNSIKVEGIGSITTLSYDRTQLHTYWHCRTPWSLQT